MTRLVSLLTFSVVFIPTLALSSGFRIPNQSVEAVGLAGAHIAYTPGPDASYYNPANMSFFQDVWQTEVSLTLLSLPSIEYTDNRSSGLDGSSEKELFLLPLLHVTSKDYGKFRFGFSLTYPYGLSKSWDQVFPQMTAEEFSLFVVEGNPTFSFAVSDMLSIGGGIRLIYGSGEVKSRVGNPPAVQLAPLTALSRDLDGDALEWGYNLALTARVTDRLIFSTTYRSEVELDLDGDALLQARLGESLVGVYSGAGMLDVPLPAVWSLAAAYSFDNMTVELVWDRTFWSSFKELDFRYDQSFLGTPFDGFDRPVAKNWEDADALRLGLSIDWNGQWKSTFGFAIDNTPVPDATLGFELPDADALLYSTGIYYQWHDRLNLGMSYMYHHTKSRSVRNDGFAGLPGVDGTFTDGGAHVVTVGAQYQF